MPAAIRNYSGENVRIFRQRTPVNVGFVIVPQQKAYVVERLGRFHRTLDSGLHFLIPFIDKVAYVHSRKEVRAAAVR
jgi:regulator of protease activity HflC (stomatin/prohibitin superfamily)